MSSSIGVYEKLGVRRVINAWGVATELGGWTLSEKSVGQAKSGTASLCGLLSGNYRAAHEPERAELLDNGKIEYFKKIV